MSDIAIGQGEDTDANEDPNTMKDVTGEPIRRFEVAPIFAIRSGHFCWQHCRHW
jgi:hypothetical protein